MRKYSDSLTNKYHNYFSNEEDEFILANYSTSMSIDEIASALGRKKASVKGRAYRLKITRWYVREFECAECGRHVKTDGDKDRRTKFCCARCEKRFWRHPIWETNGSSTVYQGGLRHALSVQNSENKKY